MQSQALSKTYWCFCCNTKVILNKPSKEAEQEIKCPICRSEALELLETNYENIIKFEPPNRINPC